MSGGRGAAMLLATVGLLALAPAHAGAEAGPCPRHLNDAQPRKRPVTPPISLTPASASAKRQVNFGTGRGTKPLTHLTVSADKALPGDIRPSQIDYDAVISRTGDTLESTDFPTPTFTQPTFSPDRKTITFAACLDAHGVSAGKYVGSITVSGPAGVEPASINVTINAKDGSLWLAGLIVSLLVAFALLLLKDAASAFDKDKGWGAAVRVPLGDLRWWAATLVALATAFGVLYAAYSNDPAWGATGLSAIASLVASTFAAVGGHSILTSFGGSS
jgi:hypothetical protein